MAQEGDGLDEIRREEQAAYKRVTAIELQREQVDSLGLIAWLVREEHFHLILVVWRTLELPA